MKRAAVCVVILWSGLLSPSPAGAQPTVCKAGRSFAGIEDASSRRFEGVKATVTATTPFSGLEGEYESVAGLVGIGDPARSYVALSLASHVNGNQLAPALEWREGGVPRFEPLSNVWSTIPWTVGHAHALLIERDERSSRWRIDIDGRTISAVPLDDGAQGLTRPHVYMSVRNKTLPCNNRGTLLFAGVYVKPAGTHAWVPFADDAAAGSWGSAQFRMEKLSETSFATGPGVSAHEFWGYWIRLYAGWTAAALGVAAALVLFWARRSYRRDVRLSARMFGALLFMVLIYLPFLMLPVFWVYGRTSSLWDAGLAFCVEFCLALAIPYFADRLVLARAGARVIDRDEAPELHESIERLCGLADLPKPRVALTHSRIPSAFATGAGTGSTIVVSEGLVERLDPLETQAVLAHELAHIANGDAFVMTILSLPVNLLGRFLTLPGRIRNLYAKIAVYVLGLVVFWWLFAPFWIVWTLATLVMFTISRYREYVADSTAALLTGGPKSLMSALVRISHALEQIPERDLREAGALTAFLIVPVRTPDRGFTLDALRMFPSHPPLSRRLARLAESARAVRPISVGCGPQGIRARLGATFKGNPLALIAFVYGIPVVVLVSGFPHAWASWTIPLLISSVVGTAPAFNALGRAQAGAPGLAYATLGLVLCLAAPLSFVIGILSGVAGVLLHPFQLHL